MNILISNILTVLCQEDRYLSKVCDIYIEGSRISSINKEPENFVADETIDGRGKLLIPGLVNTHTHVYMTMLRNIADDVDFDTWLFKKIMPVEDNLQSEDAYWSALLGCAEMIRGGVTSFLDMHMFPGVSVKAAIESGMRGVISRGLSGNSNDPEGGQRRIREAVEEYETYKNLSTKIRFMLAPHAITTCDESYLHKVSQYASDLGLGIHSHLSEGAGEGPMCMEKYGCTPTELYDRCKLLSQNTVLAHCIHLTEKDMDILAERGVSISLNPASNLKLANGVAPVCKLLDRGINCCLGTDSTASNNSLSILREMSLTSLIHKGISGNPLAVTAEDSFKMATVNGAKALGFSGVTGEITEGSEADVAIFDLNSPELTPLIDPISALSYASQSLSAHTVIVGGQILLKGGKHQTLDIERIMYEVLKRAR